jgi:hypothetical protein
MGSESADVGRRIIGFVFYGCFGPVREDEVCFDVEAPQDEEEFYAEDCAGCAGYCYDLGGGRSDFILWCLGSGFVGDKVKS